VMPALRPVRPSPPRRARPGAPAERPPPPRAACRRRSRRR
jgi:hypothetical protein